MPGATPQAFCTKRALTNDVHIKTYSYPVQLEYDVTNVIEIVVSCQSHSCEAMTREINLFESRHWGIKEAVIMMGTLKAIPTSVSSNVHEVQISQTRHCENLLFEIKVRTALLGV